MTYAAPEPSLAKGTIPDSVSSYIKAEEHVTGSVHELVLKLTDLPVSVNAPTSNAGRGNAQLYDLPLGILNVTRAVAQIKLSVATANQSDFTDGTEEGDFALGTEAADDGALSGTGEADIIPSTGFTMASHATDHIEGEMAAHVRLDGSSTAKDIHFNLVVDAADIDNDADTEVLVNGIVHITFVVE
jgi:hypothetical protein